MSGGFLHPIFRRSQRLSALVASTLIRTDLWKSDTTLMEAPLNLVSMKNNVCLCVERSLLLLFLFSITVKLARISQMTFWE